MNLSAAGEHPRGGIEGEARALAEAHRSARERPRPLAALSRLDAVADWLDRICKVLEHGEPFAKAAEWVLDNRHLVERGIREIRRDLPAGYYHRLPSLDEDGAAGLPRIYDVARSLAALSGLQLDASVVRRFVAAYQEVQPLSLAELWALPTMLRLLCLETMVDAAARVVPSISPPLEVAEAVGLLADLDDTERIARAIRGLLSVAAISWNDFVDATSVVEAVLARDPAGAYSQMDFDTRDRYRKAVELLASTAGMPEHEITHRALAAAKTAQAEQPSAHVGYWLVDEGRIDFERAIGIRPSVAVRMRRAAARHATTLYLLAVVASTVVALAVPFAYLRSQGLEGMGLTSAVLLAVLPASAVAVAVLHWAVGHLLVPRVLPKLSFAGGIPQRWRTAVVVPTMLSDAGTLRHLLATIERHYLSNADPQLSFVLLTDFVDAAEQSLPGEEDLLDEAVVGIRTLNERYRSQGHAPFHLLHRERRYNPGEGCWMGWERKRGKLEEWNRFLRGGETSFVRHEGARDELAGIRFVITLDTDTLLPRGAAARLVGILAHPLNRPMADPASGRITRGYTIVQPRVEVTPDSVTATPFARIYAGDTAIDIYSRAVSDAYQDLFGTGIYVGKGIYDLEAFERTLAGRVPENALASHDLFEGIHGRVALATDVVVYEDFPTHYLAFARRMHRWIRGDWQLLPWLRARVPAAGGGRLPSRFTALDRWKILDNLRRSLVSPALLSFLAVGWLALPGHELAWTLLAAAAPAAHTLCDAIGSLAMWRPWSRRRGGAFPGTGRRLGEQLARVALLLVFLPYEAVVVIDAVTRTLVRLGVTRKRLLQWSTAAKTSLHFAEGVSRASVWREMAAAPAIAVVLAALFVIVQPTALPEAAPFLLLWLAAPEIAHAISRSKPARKEMLTTDETVFVRRLARRTWLFFETFVGPDDHWLAPDNYQEVPTGNVDHRTSPTNIALLLTSTSAAHDLGYIGPRELATRLRSTLETVGRLQHYRGHLLNWYDTRTLEPLTPRYVSTVDSGNLAAALLALAQGCRETVCAPVLAEQRWDGLMDALALLEAALASLVSDATPSGTAALAARVAAIRHRAAHARGDPAIWRNVLDELCERECADFDRLLAQAMAAHEAPMDLPALRELRIWLDRVHRHLRAMHDDVDTLLGWLSVLEERPHAVVVEEGRPDASIVDELVERLTATLPLDAIAPRCAWARSVIARLSNGQVVGEAEDATQSQMQEWLARLDHALALSAQTAGTLVADYGTLAELAENETQAMDFRLVYDAERQVFYIGYSVSADALDPHHYDLLASECRLASYVAIAKGDVPVTHWFHLGRPVTRVSDSLALLSWGGTMFEYLMPTLFLESDRSALLGRSELAAIEAQRIFARLRGLPWGVSESGYAAMDADSNYRYRAFGVPGLGLDRGLADAIVVAPYASVLALPLRPAAVYENLRTLKSLGAIGEFGLHEAVDFTPSRVPRGSECTLVRSYMAHHQGMCLAAFDNALCGAPLVRRFHSHPLARTVELLLHERVPAGVPVETAGAAPRRPPPRPAEPKTLYPWTPVQGGAFPEIHVLGNGRMTTIVTDAGAGGLQWTGRALTRWHPDATLDASGMWIYARDLDDGHVWSVGRQPTGVRAEESEVIFHPHMVELRRRDHGVAIRAEIAVAPLDDVEIRRLTIVNETDRPRRVALSSYAEVALAPIEQDRAHPAFSKLFVRSEFLEGLGALLFQRRPRRLEEQPPALMHRMVADGKRIRLSGVATSRERVLGRYGSERSPHLGGFEQTRVPAWPLDPIMSLEATVELAPHETQGLAFVTLASASPESLPELAARYDSLAALDWAVADAASESMREATRLEIEPGLLPSFQQLLSVVLQPHALVRGSAAASADDQLSQHDLWRMGLSGDIPVLLVRLDDPSDTRLLHDLLRAHRLWNVRGIRVDLVVLAAGISGYDDPLASEVHRVLERLGCLNLLQRSGGVHLLRAPQVGAEEVGVLGVAARAELAGGRPLHEQLRNLHRQPERLPPFLPGGSPVEQGAGASAERPADLLFDNGTGGFNAGDREYVVSLAPGASTPAPWCNVIANGEIGCVVSEAGGGYTWVGNSVERRLSPWRNDPVCDVPGEALYLRDEASGVVWMPMAPDAQSAVEVRHAPGCSRWARTAQGLEQRVEVLVAERDPVKLVRLRLRNTLERPRRITATYFVEWVLGSSRDAGTAFTVSEYDADASALLARNTWSPTFSARVAFLATDRRVHGFTTDRREFLGREGEVRHPAGLSRWGLSGAVTAGADPCAALMVHLELAAGEEVAAHFVLGEGRDREHAHALIAAWRDATKVEREAGALRAHWDHVLGALTVHTPDPGFDVMLNGWLLYQTLASRVLARTGFYQSSGAYGFRDQLQDVMALVHAEPGLVREHILASARQQFEQGDVLHWWHRPGGRGVRTRCSDDLLWLAFVTAHYVETTGDLSILDERVPFLSAPPLGRREEDRYAFFETGGAEASLFDHCLRGLEHGATHGAHGLPLIGDGDWNDGMNRVGKGGRGESVWLAWFVIATAKAFARVCVLRGERELAEGWGRRARALAAAAEKAAWDGAWYRRAYDDDGRPWGSKTCEECRIDSVSQSWAVLCGEADPLRARQALESAERELVRASDHLACLLWPPFDRTPRDPGYIKAYPPGIRENGGQYSHAVAWLGWAFAKLGDGERALRLWHMVSPIEHAATPQAVARYRVEPYVVAADIASVPPYVGRGGWTWYTGAAAWSYRLGVEAILGLRLRDGKLAIDPCLPSSWPGFEAVVRGKAGAIEISVDNTSGSGRGVIEVTVDGEHVEAGTLLSLPEGGRTAKVRVRLGQAAARRRSAGSGEL